MKISFDGEADALYVEIAKGRFHTNKKVDATTVLDLDKNGRVLGLEVIGIRDKIGAEGILKLMVQIQQKKSTKPIIENFEIPLTS